MGVILPPPSIGIQGTAGDPNQLTKYVLPYVMLWDPVGRVTSDNCLQHGCCERLTVKCWRVGQSNSLQPRLIHCVEHVTVLVSPAYYCEQGHTFTSTDPSLTHNLEPDNYSATSNWVY